MKKFIALSVAVVMLLFGFAAVTEVNVVEDGNVKVCSDLKPKPEPYDGTINC